MIDPKTYGIEVGDRVRITIEGVVTEDCGELQVRGLALRKLAGLYHPPTVEILEQAKPKWHSAQVIRASYMGNYPPEHYLQAEHPDGELTFINGDGDYFAPEELRDVEVIVQ